MSFLAMGGLGARLGPCKPPVLRRFTIGNGAPRVTSGADSYPVPPPDPAALEDGRLDEVAAWHGVTIRQVRRMVGPKEIERPGAAAVDTDEVVHRSQAGPPTTADEEPAADDDGRLEELAASMGVTLGDVRRMVELAPRRTYRGRLDVDEIARRYQAGESLAEIGAAMGASDTRVRNAMVRVGIPTRPGPRPAGERRGPLHRLDVDGIRRRREAGETIKGIARAISASDSGVGRAIKRWGIEADGAAGLMALRSVSSRPRGAAIGLIEGYLVQQAERPRGRC